MRSDINLRTVATLARDLSAALDDGNRIPDFKGDEIAAPSYVLDLLDACSALSGVASSVIKRLPILIETPIKTEL